jgi:hypothetical protein
VCHDHPVGCRAEWIGKYAHGTARSKAPASFGRADPQTYFSSTNREC